MNSCIYDCTVMHARLSPIENRFEYRVSMFYLDLDEVDEVARRIAWISRDRFNLFSFRDSDHFQFGGKTLRENVGIYLRSNGINPDGLKIRVLTYLRTLGHYFNPVSFYFCSNQNDEPVAAIVEVENTFKELKPYVLGPATRTDEGGFNSLQTKYFYVSPFIDMDAQFDFRLRVPQDQLKLVIHDVKDGSIFFSSALSGFRKPLSNASVLWSALRFPLVTLQVITLIHWQALRLWLLKKQPFFRKNEHRDLQKEVQRVNFPK